MQLQRTEKTIPKPPEKHIFFGSILHTRSTESPTQRPVHRKGSAETWGNKFIDNLSYDIQIAFPDRKGYSVRNLKYMAKFAARFSDRKIVQEVLAQITWYHNIALMDKVKNNVVAEYSLKDISKPIGVSEYKITICWN